MAKSLRDQVVALAGVAQAAQLVDQLARRGAMDSLAFETSIASLFVFDADSTDDVFGGLRGIDNGLAALDGIFSPGTAAQLRAPARYMSGMIFLERQLSAREDMLEVIHSRLQHAAFNARHFSENPSAVTHSVAGIYQDTVSTFKFRIQVTGDMQQLQNPAQAEKIRSLLLAGIRAAILWRQVGGRRWHLLLRKNATRQTVRALRRELAG